MDDFEAFFRELDRRYATSLTPRVRKATVTAAASPSSYSILLPGETIDRASVPSVSPIVPQVGDQVRLELVGDEPCIVGVYAPQAQRVSADVATLQTTTSTSYTNLTTAGPAATVNLVAGQSALITVSARMFVSAVGATQANMAFDVTGVESLAAADVNAAEQTDSQSATVTRPTVYTAAVTGAHTFTAKYKVIGAITGSFLNRRIVVEL